MADSIPETNQGLYRAGQVRELDRMAIETYQIPGLDLMERAGKAAWECLQTSWPDAKNIVVICGAGNNAGDGYVIGRLALEHGCNVELIALAEPVALKGDARQAAEKFMANGQPLIPYSGQQAIVTDVIVDAVLGTGIDREVAGDYLAAITSINNSDAPVLSVDIPSGLNADTGKVMGAGVKADLTITFIGRKQGLYTGDGREHTGKLVFSDLGIPAEIHDAIKPASTLISMAQASGLLSKRKRSGHKGDYGHVLVVGG
ncbi:MAG: NAD(P)H-hydrate epimerase, partial [Gammaproteobacteria bacterium]